MDAAWSSIFCGESPQAVEVSTTMECSISPLKPGTPRRNGVLPEECTPRTPGRSFSKFTRLFTGDDFLEEKPINAYMIWYNANKNAVAQKLSTSDSAVLADQCTVIWAGLASEERAPWVEKENVLNKSYASYMTAVSKCMGATLPEPSSFLQSLQLSQCSMSSSPKPKVGRVFDVEGLELSNKSGKKYAGTKFHTLRGRWSGTVVYKTKPIYIGLFSTEVEAAKAVKEAKQLIKAGTFTKPTKTTKTRCRRWLNAGRIAENVKVEGDKVAPGTDNLKVANEGVEVVEIPPEVTMPLRPAACLEDGEVVNCNNMASEDLSTSSDPTARAEEDVASQHVNSTWSHIFRQKDKMEAPCIPMPLKRRRLSRNSCSNLQSGMIDGSAPSNTPCSSAKRQCTSPDRASPNRTTAVDAFSRWMQANQAQIAKELGTSDFLEVTHKCMEVWKNMSSEEQAAWIGRPVFSVDEDGFELSDKISSAGKYRGVHFHGLTQKWTTGVRYEGQYLYLGLYNTPKEAARARFDAKKSISNGTFVKPEKKRRSSAVREQRR